MTTKSKPRQRKEQGRRSLHKVLACPFCGKPPRVNKVGENQAAEMIECATLGCVNPHISYYGDGVSREKWNRRAG